MNQPNDPRNPADESRPSWAGASGPPDEGTTIMEPAVAAGDSPATPPGAATATCPNPACRQPVGPDVRFCQACGTELDQPKRPPWLIIAALVWLLLAIGAYMLLYSSAFVVRP